MPKFNVQAAKQAGYSDAEIQAFIAQNPSLQGAAPAANPSPQPVQPQKGTNEKVADFLGISNFGKGIAQAGANIGFGGQVQQRQQQSQVSNNEIQAQVEKLRKQYPAQGRPKEVKDKIAKLLGLKDNQFGGGNDLQSIAAGPEGYVSNKQVAGSALNLATLVAGAGAGGGVTRAARVAEGAALGAGGGAGQALNDNGSGLDVAKSALLGGALGGGLTLGTEAAVSGLKKVAKNTAEGVYNMLVKTPKNQLLAGKEEIGTGLMKRGVTGSYGKMADKVQAIATKNNQQLSQVIEQNASKPVDIGDVNKALFALKNRLEGTPGESTGQVDRVIADIEAIAKKNRPGHQAAIEAAMNAGDLQEAANIAASIPQGDAYRAPMLSMLKSLGAPKPNGVPVSKIPEVLPLGAAQALKQNLQKAVNESFLRQNATGVTEAQKVAAQKLRLAIEQAAPEVKPLNKELEFSVRALKRLTEQANLSPSKLRLYAELGAGIWGLKDTTQTGKIGIPLQVIAAERLLTNPSTASRAAQLGYKAAESQLPAGITNAARRLVTRQVGKSSAK